MDQTLRPKLENVDQEIEKIEKAFLAETSAADAVVAAPAPGEDADDEAADIHPADFGGYSVPEKADRSGTTPPPTPEQDPVVDGAVMRPLEVPELVELSTELGALVRSGGMRGDARGRFYGPGGIRIARYLFEQQHAHDLAEVLAHEIGHLVDWLPTKTLKRGNLLGHLMTLDSFLRGSTFVKGERVKNAEIKAELHAVSLARRPWDPTSASTAERRYRNAATELYADALSMLLTNPAFLRTHAPKFWQTFFASVDKKPDVRGAYFALQDLMAGDRRILLEHRQELLEEGFKEADRRADQIQRDKEKTARWAWWNPVAWFQAIIDNTYALERKLKPILLSPNQDPLLRLKALNHHNLRPWTAEHVEPILETIQEAGIGIDLFGDFLTWKRVAEGDRSEILNPKGVVTATSAAELMAAARARLTAPQLRALDKAMDATYAALKGVQTEAYEAGLYDEDLHKMMQESEAYVPFQVVDYIDQRMSTRVHRQHGTARAIANPFVSAVTKMLVTKREIAVNSAKALALKTLGKHFAGEVEKVPVETFKLKDDSVRQREKRVRDPNKGVVHVYEAGRRRGYVVDKYIAQSIDRMTAGEMAGLTRLVGGIHANVFRRIFITHNPAFFLFNVIRDMPRMWVNNPHMGVTTIPRDLMDVMRAIPGAVVRATGSDRAKVWFPKAAEKVAAAETASIFAAVQRSDWLLGRAGDYHSVDEQVSRILGKTRLDDESAGRKLWRRFKSVFDAIETVGNFFEAWTKMAGLLSEERKAGSVEAIDQGAAQRVRSLYGTHDYAAGGLYGRQISAWMLFANAFIQGGRSDLQVATRPRTRGAWWWKRSIVTLLPVTLMWAAEKGLIGGDEDDDEENWLRDVFTRMSSFDKMLYNLLPLGVMPDGRGIALRVPRDYSGRVIGVIWRRMLDMMGGNEELTKVGQELVNDMAREMPNVSPVIDIPTDLLTAVSGGNPWDNFRQRYLFSEDELAAGGKWKWQKYGRYLLQQLGGQAFVTFNLDARPRRREPIDNVIAKPLIGPVVGRFIRRTDAGLRQAAERGSDVAEKGEAERRLRGRDEKKAAVKRYMGERTGDEDSDRRLRRTIAKETAQTIARKESPPSESFRKYTAYRNRQMRAVRLDLLFQENAPMVGSIAQAGSHEQAKEAARGLIEAGIPKADLRRWLGQAQREDILSSERRRAILPLLKDDK